MTRLATGKISNFYLVFVAQETGLSLPCWKPQREVFSRRGPNDAGETLSSTVFQRLQCHVDIGIFITEKTDKIRTCVLLI